jgi:hypothetical protein
MRFVRRKLAEYSKSTRPIRIIGTWSDSRVRLPAFARRHLAALAMIAAVLFAVTADGQISYVDVTAASGLDFVHHVPMPPASPVGPSLWAGSGAAVADYDLDGDLDVYLVDSFGWPNRLFRNNGDRTFAEVTEGSGLADTGSGRMALFLDLDNDGDPDLVLGNETQGYAGLTSSRVYRNDYGVFADVSAGSGFDPQGIILGGMSATDFNHDGLLDIYVTQWDVINGTPFNYFYQGLGDFRFMDVTESVGLRADNTEVSAWASVFLDLDNDGDQDLFTAVDFDVNYYFRLEGASSSNPHFVDDSLVVRPFHCCNDSSGNDMGIAVGDVEGDGDLDLFTTNITLPPPNEQLRTNALLVNHGLPAPFTDEAVDRGIWQSYWGWGTAFFDADLDGDLDLYSVNGRGAGDGGYWSDRSAQLFVNDGAGNSMNGSGYFTEMAAQAGADHRGNSRGLVPFDYDRDGDADLLIVNVAQPAALLENVTPTPHRWLALKFRAVSGNRDAVGAKVKIRVNGREQMRELFAGGSLYTSIPFEAHFGLENALRVDAVNVEWLGGGQTSWVNVPSNQYFSIVEGAPAPTPVLVGLEIEGPSEVPAENAITLAARAVRHFAPDMYVEPLWSVSPAGIVTVAANGVLVAGVVEDDVDVQITAMYGSISATHVVRVRAEMSPIGPAPVIEITRPTAAASYFTTEAQVDLAGTITEDAPIVSVAWSASALSGGPCSVSGLNWTCDAVRILPGEQTITVELLDAADRRGSDVITITRVVEETSAPVLIVAPISIVFEPDTTSTQIRVSLQGEGELSYSVESNQAWITVFPISGRIGAQSVDSLHEIRVNREILVSNQPAEATILVTAESSDVPPVSIAVQVHGISDPVSGQEPPDENPTEPSVNDPPVSPNDETGNDDLQTDDDEPRTGGSPASPCSSLAVIPTALLLLAFTLLRKTSS